jgi:translation initiation factor 4A
MLMLEYGRPYTSLTYDYLSFLQTCNIIQYLPAKIQIVLFSATFSSEALETSHWFMDKHVTIKVPIDEELKGIGIKQFYHKVEKEEKLGKLYALLDTLDST